MESILAHGTDCFAGGYINLIWSNAVYKTDEEDVEDIETDTGQSDVEGMEYYHVGFQKMAVEWLYPFWVHHAEAMGEDYTHMYYRPPIITGNRFTGYYGP